jgi:hypothetical protein
MKRHIDIMIMDERKKLTSRPISIIQKYFEPGSLLREFARGNMKYEKPRR